MGIPEVRRLGDDSNSGATSASEGDPVVVACAADARYALPIAVMLCSVLAHLDARRRLVAYIVDDGILLADKVRIEASLSDRAEIHWLAPRRERFAGLPLWGGMPLATYDKLMAAELLPATLCKVLWLDGDLLVLADLAPLYDRDHGGRHVLAAPDALVARVSARFGVAGYRDLGIPADAGYFNAGVMLIDLAAWRRDDVAGRALEYLQRYGERVFFMDQEALNAVLAGRWGELDARWNWSATRDRLAPRGAADESIAPDLPWILHFCGKVKPWRYDNGDAHHRHYYRHLDMTAWRGARPPRSVARALLGFYASSRLRRSLYPIEHWGTRLVRRFTRRSAGVAARPTPAAGSR